MIASEANPYVKTGGLADVVYALSREMSVTGEQVYVFIPLYNQVRKKLQGASKIAEFTISMGWRREGANIYLENRDGISFLLVENRHYFERDNIYGYDDDGERFAFFSQAVIKAMEELELKPDIVHVHDWQPGMVPCLIKENKMPFFKGTKFVLSIHNPAFQGIIDKYSLGDLYNLPVYLYDSGMVRFGNVVSTLKAGIVYSDKITTVSPSHRQELLTPEGSMGLDKVLIYREYDFCGFLNGIDYDEFDPVSDPFIPHHFSATNFLSGKHKDKVELCERLGLSNPDAPLFSLVSRVTWQKGMTLVFAAVHELVKRGANVVLLGSGEYDYEQEMNRLHMLYPNNVSVYIGYNNELAHQIYAASDFFMMPSLFEPCGLGQMIAQRYGTLPIVRRVGGLRDSVINYDGKNVDISNGFGFDAFSDFEMIRTCHYALDTYYDRPEDFKKLVRNALATDNSWSRSGEQYHGLYRDLISNK